MDLRHWREHAVRAPTAGICSPSAYTDRRTADDYETDLDGGAQFGGEMSFQRARPTGTTYGPERICN